MSSVKAKGECTRTRSWQRFRKSPRVWFVSQINVSDDLAAVWKSSSLQTFQMATNDVHLSRWCVRGCSRIAVGNIENNLSVQNYFISFYKYSEENYLLEDVVFLSTCNHNFWSVYWSLFGRSMKKNPFFTGVILFRKFSTTLLRSFNIQANC